MVIVGGSGYFFGPFVGALISVLLPEWMRITEGYYLIVYAALVMVMMAFCPYGMLGMIERAIKAMTAQRDRRTGSPRKPNGWAHDRRARGLQLAQDASAASPRSTMCRSRCAKAKFSASSGRTDRANLRCSTACSAN